MPETMPDKLVANKRSMGSISAVAWTPREDLDYHDWGVEGRRIGLMWRGSPWWVGDWLLYGSARWGEQYVVAAKITLYDPKTLRNLRYVASRFELSLRRDNLTWSHHALLASFESDEQHYWLERATADRLTVEDLRVELRSAQRGSHLSSCASDPGPTATARVHVIICPHCGGQIKAPEHIADSPTPTLITVARLEGQTSS
jgi:hypothetical protein